MSKIFADEKRIFLDNWNSAYGNKILHVLFLIHLADRSGKSPIMYKGSNLDNIFNFKFETIEIQKLNLKSYYYVEKDSFYVQNKLLKALNLYYRFYVKNLDSVVLKNYEHFLERKRLLNSHIPDKDIKIRGHFFDSELMPSIEIFNKYIEVKRELKESIQKKYPDLISENCVAVHYRGTDFNNHMKHLFPIGIQLDEEYYYNAIERVEKIVGSNLVYHLFSDDIGFLKKIFREKKIVIHEDKPYEDWVSMFIVKNIIQSNSSFCWTAALYNKLVSIQPEDGYNYHQKTGSIPFGFHHKDAILINKQ